MKERLIFNVYVVIIVLASLSIFSFLFMGIKDIDKLNARFERTPSKVSYYSAKIVSNGVENFRRAAITVKLSDGQIVSFDLAQQKPSALKTYQLLRGENIRVKSLTKPGFPCYRVFEIVPNV